MFRFSHHGFLGGGGGGGLWFLPLATIPDL